MPYSSTGRPATALSPMLVASLPSKRHISVPSSRTSTRGAWSAKRAGSRPSNMSGGSTTWSSTLTSTRSSSCMAPPAVRRAARPDAPFPDTRVGDHCIVGAVTPQGRGAGEPSPMALEGLRILDFTRLGFGAQATLDLRLPGGRGHPGGEHPLPRRHPGHAALRARARASGARPSGPPPSPTPRGAPAPTGAGSSTSTTPAGKKSITVDARHPDGPGAAQGPRGAVRRRHRELRGGHAGALGPLLRRACAQIRPDVVYVSMCGFGHEGPDTRHVTMGPTAQALTGLTFMVGLPDRPPAGWSFSYLDHVGGYLGAVAILAGVIHRRPHRRGPAHRRVAARAGHRPVGGAAPRRRA